MRASVRDKTKSNDFVSRKLPSPNFIVCIEEPSYSHIPWSKIKYFACDSRLLPAVIKDATFRQKNAAIYSRFLDAAYYLRERQSEGCG